VSAGNNGLAHDLVCTISAVWCRAVTDASMQGLASSHMCPILREATVANLDSSGVGEGRFAALSVPRPFLRKGRGTRARVCARFAQMFSGSEPWMGDRQRPRS